MRYTNGNIDKNMELIMPIRFWEIITKKKHMITSLNPNNFDKFIWLLGNHKHMCYAKRLNIIDITKTVDTTKVNHTYNSRIVTT